MADPTPKHLGASQARDSSLPGMYHAFEKKTDLETTAASPQKPRNND